MTTVSSSLIGVTLVVAGSALTWLGIHLWHAKKKHQDGWKALMAFLVVLAGLGIGGGASLLLGMDLLYYKVGVFPLWSVLALTTGIWFLVDLIGRHGWTRTSVLGFITAALIAVPIAPPALAAGIHHQAPQVTSVTRHG